MKCLFIDASMIPFQMAGNGWLDEERRTEWLKEKGRRVAALRQTRFKEPSFDIINAFENTNVSWKNNQKKSIVIYLTFHTKRTQDKITVFAKEHREQPTYFTKARD